MTTYSKRDIRAADVLAITLVGVGFVALIFAAMPLLLARSGKEVSGASDLWFLAAVFVILGVVLNLKIRQLVRNQGREPEDYPGVPE